MVIDVTNTITIDAGGYRTKTTKDRLNQFLRCRGVQISQKKGIRYIHGSNGDFEFVDGTEIHGDGYVVLPKEKGEKRNDDDLDIDQGHEDLYGLRKKEEF
jgi:hypothetical protein